MKDLLPVQLVFYGGRTPDYDGKSAGHVTVVSCNSDPFCRPSCQIAKLVLTFSFQRGINIVVLDIASGTDPDVLSRIPTYSADVMRVPSFDRLQEFRSPVVMKMCVRPPPPPPNQGAAPAPTPPASVPAPVPAPAAPVPVPAPVPVKNDENEVDQNVVPVNSGRDDSAPNVQTVPVIPQQGKNPVSHISAQKLTTPHEKLCCRLQFFHGMPSRIYMCVDSGISNWQV